MSDFFRRLFDRQPRAPMSAALVAVYTRTHPAYALPYRRFRR